MEFSSTSHHLIIITANWELRRERRADGDGDHKNAAACCLNKEPPHTNPSALDMPMLKRPVGLTGLPQGIKSNATSAQLLLPLQDDQDLSLEIQDDEIRPRISTPAVAFKTPFVLHKNCTPPTSLKPAQPPIAAGAAQVPFQSPIASPQPSSSGSSLHPLRVSSNFAAPRQSDAGALTVQQPSALAAAVAPERIFACMFTKVSKKKHKTWSDGFVVLNLNAKKLTLKDAEGKDIGKMGWQSPSFTSDLKNGSVMNFVCGYDLELCQEIEFSQYSSGQCFLSKSKKVSCISSVAIVSGLKATPFLAHSDGAPALRKVAVPLHSPDEPGAVVLVNGNAARGTVAIVLEPRLASLLRPHQLDGITFCVTCLLGGEPERATDLSSRRQFGPGHLPEGRSSAAFQGGAILADDMGLGDYPSFKSNFKS